MQETEQLFDEEKIDQKTWKTRIVTMLTQSPKRFGIEYRTKIAADVKLAANPSQFGMAFDS